MPHKDWICNYLGVERTIAKVEYSGAAEFAAASLSEYTLNGTSYGEFKTAGSLNYLKVHAAGHEVAYYRELDPQDVRIGYEEFKLTTRCPFQNRKSHYRPLFRLCRRSLWNPRDRCHYQVVIVRISIKRGDKGIEVRI